MQNESPIHEFNPSVSHQPSRRSAMHALLILLVPVATGCFDEQSFPMRPQDRIEPSSVLRVSESSPVNCRAWLRDEHKRLAPTLPDSRANALLTEDLADADGHPADVMAHFGIKESELQTIFGNLSGMLHSAQCVGRAFPWDAPPEPWPGFETVMIPVSDSIKATGWLGLSRNKNGVRNTDCIVLVPGLYGHNVMTRMEDTARALMDAGHHVLAYTNRGHGLTEAMRPDVPYNYGVIESRDLLAVADWLQAKPYITRTGLIGYCWGANQALVSGWYANLDGPDENFVPALAERMPPPPNHPRFTAGILAFSPTINFEKIIDALRTRHYFLEKPVYASLQETIIDRQKFKKHPVVDGSLRHAIDEEFARSELNYPNSVEDALAFLRLVPYKDLSAAKKLARFRVPMVLIYGANDPLAPAQEVAELFAGVKNPNVAAVILPTGGHIGFPAITRKYYYNIILDFFDPIHGASPIQSAPVTPSSDPPPEWITSHDE